jgi:hypothetical protein
MRCKCSRTSWYGATARGEEQDEWLTTLSYLFCNSRFFLGGRIDQKLIYIKYKMTAHWKILNSAQRQIFKGRPNERYHYPPKFLLEKSITSFTIYYLLYYYFIPVQETFKINRGHCTVNELAVAVKVTNGKLVGRGGGGGLGKFSVSSGREVHCQLWSEGQ